MDLLRERRWLALMAGLTFVELVWWAICWRAGLAPAPRLGISTVLALAALLAAFALRATIRPRGEHASWGALLLGTILIAVGASLFLPLKYAIPGQIHFWLDAPLALGERHVFGADPWRIADRAFGWALVPVDRIYALWLPVQSVVLFSVLLLPPSARKSRALSAYSLAWFLLGVVAALLCASAGPIFYDRLLGSQQFAGLAAPSRAGAWMVRSESDAMWTSFASGRPGLVAGLSAMPSLHVAISVWIWLTARNLAPAVAPVALAYAVFMWVASVQLGWHYVSDGIVGALGMLAIWWLADRIAGDDLARTTDESLRSLPTDSCG